jgi:hypothetical protein
MSATKSLLAPTSLHQGLEIRHAKRVVQPLVDGAFEDEPVLVGLSSLGHHDEFTYAHAVNVTQVAVTMGHALGLDRRALADLGVAALMHDVGKHAVAEEIKNPLDEFTDAERAACERHPAEGVKLLARSTALNSSTLRCMRASLEHHLMLNGRGYPTLDGWQPSVLSQIIGVADCYVCLQTYRSRHGANVRRTRRSHGARTDALGVRARAAVGARAGGGALPARPARRTGRRAHRARARPEREGTRPAARAGHRAGGPAPAGLR